MAREKKLVPPAQQMAVRDAVLAMKQKLRDRLKEARIARQEASTHWVETTFSRELEQVLPEKVLAMNFMDFVESPPADLPDPNNTAAGADESMMSAEVPGTGLRINLPKHITPRVTGKQLHPRASERGECLFSVNGTPVLSKGGAEPTPDLDSSTIELIKKAEEGDSPETRRLLADLKKKLKEKVLKGNGKDDDNGGATA
ncbi:hypothetical protein AAVH_17674 [Aphelenchoides avenae]|nr:hypothetical protein AAVH_17674 [Aphelenchus avenae]